MVARSSRIFRLAAPGVAAVIASVTLTLAPIARPLPSATATGNCSAAYMNIYQHNQSEGGGGLWHTFCGGVSDGDIESESPRLIMGPMNDGNFYDDWHVSTAASGISSIYFYDNPNDGSDYHGCLWFGKTYVQLLKDKNTSGWAHMDFINNDHAGSSKVKVGSC